MKEIRVFRQLGMFISGVVIIYLAVLLATNVYLGNRNRAILNGALLALNFGTMTLYFKKY